MVESLNPPIESKCDNTFRHGNQCCTRVNLSLEGRT